MFGNDTSAAFKYKYNENTENSSYDVEEKNEIYICNICGKNFYGKASLTIHVNSHNFNSNNINMSGDEKSESQNTCSTCFKKFTAKKNLLKHLREVHKNYSEADRMVVKKIKCPQKNCEFLCRMMKELRDHIEKYHKIKILKDILQFPSEEVFQKWKKEEECSTVSWFVTGRKKTTLMDGTKKQTLYCHRTGHYNPKGFGKYRMRSVGSCKIGVTCPAAMEVVESPEGEISVIYYKTHLGHMQDVVYLKLTQEERAQLADKINQGFSFDAILEDVKESLDFEQEKKKRIHLLSKKDLYSIMRTANCNSRKNIIKENNEEGQKCKENPAFHENPLEGENVEVGGIEENNALYSPQSFIFPPKKDNHFEENPNCAPYQKHQRDILQSSGEGVASQIVILSPDVDCTSFAEIILLSAGDGSPAQPAILSQTKTPAMGNCSIQKLESQTQIFNGAEEKNQTNKSNLHLQLKEKLNKISELLPQAEYLTPKQFDLVNTKLNGVLDIFKVAHAKASARKQNSKKKVIKKNRILRSSGAMGDKFECEVQENHLGQQLIYAVCN